MSLRHKEDIEEKPAERRPKTRKRVLMAGIVVSSDGRSSIDCTIRDLSETGARIVAAKGARLPSNFYLINIRDRVAYEASLVRNDAPEAGIAFKATLPLSTLTDPAKAFLKQLWLSKATR